MPSNRLQPLRETIGWSRERLGNHLGVHERTIRRWEKGESRIPDEAKAALCDLFGVSLDHLMGRKPNGNGENGSGLRSVA